MEWIYMIICGLALFRLSDGQTPDAFTCALVATAVNLGPFSVIWLFRKNPEAVPDLCNISNSASAVFASGLLIYSFFRELPW